MQSLPRFLAMAGAAITGPSFVFNYIAHGGKMPGPGELDRADGAFSVMFIVGAALVFAAIVLTRPLPLGPKGRWLLAVEGVLITMAIAWAVVATIDPQRVEDPNVLVALCDATWPLHQVFMLVVGITAARAKLWPSSARYALFGPVVGILLLGIGAASGLELLASIGIGLGWVIAAAGVLKVTSETNSQEAQVGAQPEPAY